MSQGSFELETPEEIGGHRGNWLKEAGWYHCQVTSLKDLVKDNPGAFEAHLSVLNGTVIGQEKKEVKLTFFPPKLDSKDKGEMARRKMTNFARATNILELNPQVGVKYKVDLGASAGQQVVVHVEYDERKPREERKFLQLAFDDVYHVDDPAVKDVPKSATALNVLPPTLRHKAEEFPVAGGSPQQPQAPTQKSPGTTAGGAVNLDDI